MAISILLADDHKLVLRGVRGLLEIEPDFHVVGEASTGVEALEKTVQLNPDVVVIDLSLPDIIGTEIIRQIHSLNSNTQIIVLSMYSKDAYVYEALKNGALSYVLKSAQPEELVHAIRLAVFGVRYLSPPLSEIRLTQYTQRNKNNTTDKMDTLTNRERQILYLASGGRSNNEIAKHLHISRRTVEVHRAKMMEKLGLRNISELLRYAIQKDIITLDQEDKN